MISSSDRCQDIGEFCGSVKTTFAISQSRPLAHSVSKSMSMSFRVACDDSRTFNIVLSGPMVANVHPARSFGGVLCEAVLSDCLICTMSSRGGGDLKYTSLRAHSMRVTTPKLS